MDTQYLLGLFGLQDKVTVVTGGGGVLCGCMAKALARAGAKVAVLDLNLEAAQKVAQDIRAGGNAGLAVQADVLDQASLGQALTQISAQLGPVDVLVNGAGGNKKEATTSVDLSFFDLPRDAFQWVFNLNFLGTLLCCQVFGRPMAERDSGAILNIASLTALRPLTNVPAYSAAKAAVVSLTQWLAVHMSHNYSKNIRVNALAPGFFLTEQNRYLLFDQETGEPTPRASAILDHTPMARFGVPEDLIGVALWLLSPSAAFTHGTVVTVDGGFNAFGGV
ncbi:MAG: SDR family oxidoreductase [Anaerolineales bacterium]|nr:MAG: SDR family oxidoreductase [Anaerolineales bacterium]